MELLCPQKSEWHYLNSTTEAVTSEVSTSELTTSTASTELTASTSVKKEPVSAATGDEIGRESRSETTVVLCIYDLGSFWHIPVLHFCIKHVQFYNKYIQQMEEEMKLFSACGYEDGPTIKIIQVSVPERCHRSRYAEALRAHYVTWVLAKMNYCLLTAIFLLIICLYVRWTCQHGAHQRYRKKFFLPLLVTVNIVWLIWRLQETLQWEINWRENYPYLCMFTNSVCYVSEAQCLYLFAYSSLERCHAVAAPLKWRATNTTVARRLAIVVGFVVGMISSTLNIILISTMDDKDIMKTCTITELPSQQTLPLHFLIGIKIINLLCVYCLPCSVLILANIAIIVAGKYRNRIKSSRTRRNKKLSYIFGFLVFSSPVHDVLPASTHLRSETGI